MTEKKDIAAKKKNFVIKIEADEVMYTNFSTSKDGYNSASLVVKKADKEYMRVYYEWEGDGPVPSFAMDLMGFMTANKEVVEASKEGKAEELISYNERH